MSIKELVELEVKILAERYGYSLCAKDVQEILHVGEENARALMKSKLNEKKVGNRCIISTALFVSWRLEQEEIK